jgi:hypothetical protein
MQHTGIIVLAAVRYAIRFVVNSNPLATVIATGQLNALYLEQFQELGIPRETHTFVSQEYHDRMP